jgi:hypothetical protein
MDGRPSSSVSRARRRLPDRPEAHGASGGREGGAAGGRDFIEKRPAAERIVRRWPTPCGRPPARRTDRPEEAAAAGPFSALAACRRWPRPSERWRRPVPAFRPRREQRRQELVAAAPDGSPPAFPFDGQLRRHPGDPSSGCSVTRGAPSPARPKRAAASSGGRRGMALPRRDRPEVRPGPAEDAARLGRRGGAGSGAAARAVNAVAATNRDLRPRCVPPLPPRPSHRLPGADRGAELRDPSRRHPALADISRSPAGAIACARSGSRGALALLPRTVAGNGASCAMRWSARPSRRGT